jgi:hypothetical protein
MGRTACTQPQCLYKGALYPYLLPFTKARITTELALFGLSCIVVKGRYSKAGTATRYGLHSPGVESRWRGGEGGRFSALVRTGPGAHPVSYTMGTEPFPGINRPGRGVNHPPRPASTLKKNNSTSSSHSVPSRHTTGQTFTFFTTHFCHIRAPQFTPVCISAMQRTCVLRYDFHKNYYSPKQN